MLGPWTIPQDDKKKKKATTKPINNLQELLVLTIIDPDTNFMEMIALMSKNSSVVARAFDQVWLCRYPRPLECVHDAVMEFTGFEFQELLQWYGIKPRPITVNKPQANSILEQPDVFNHPHVDRYQ
jgi:transposase InsO family protein